MLINASALHDERFRLGERAGGGDDDDVGQDDGGWDDGDDDDDGGGGVDASVERARRWRNGLCHSTVMFSTRKIF